MTVRAILVAVLACSACGDERGLPQGFLERAQQDPTELATAATASNTATGVSGASSTPDAPQWTNDTADRALLLTGAADEESAAQADAAAAEMVDDVVEQLHLGTAPEITLPAGDQPFQVLAREPRFRAFAAECRRYHQMRRALRPLGQKLASGTATPAELAQHQQLEAASMAEQGRLSRIIWKRSANPEERTAMSWIMFASDVLPVPSP